MGAIRQFVVAAGAIDDSAGCGRRHSLGAVDLSVASCPASGAW